MAFRLVRDVCKMKLMSILFRNGGFSDRTRTPRTQISIRQNNCFQTPHYDSMNISKSCNLSLNSIEIAETRFRVPGFFRIQKLWTRFTTPILEWEASLNPQYVVKKATLIVSWCLLLAWNCHYCSNRCQNFTQKIEFLRDSSPYCSVLYIVYYVIRPKSCTLHSTEYSSKKSLLGTDFPKSTQNQGIIRPLRQLLAPTLEVRHSEEPSTWIYDPMRSVSKHNNIEQLFN